MVWGLRIRVSGKLGDYPKLLVLNPKTLNDQSLGLVLASSKP